jgi:arylsulfatase A-like enzyme
VGLIRRIRSALVFLSVGASIVVVPTVAAAATRPPNIVVILTDDQPVNTLQRMPNVQRLQAGGVTFTRAIITDPLCCPSRATILTGLFAHSTGVYTNGDAGDTAIGGHAAFEANGNETRTIATYLDAAGYRTGLFGKYMNRYFASDDIPPGWDRFHAFVGANANYYDYQAVHFTAGSGRTLRRYGSDRADYSTDVFGRRAFRFLRAQDGAAPFFVLYAPYAPHGPIVPAAVDRDVTAPGSYRTPAWNERDVSDKPAYIRSQDPITADLAARWDRTYGTLASVDRWLGRFRNALAARGLLRSTVFLFLSDNGFTWGDHRWNSKRAPYERSIRVPFVMSGPGIPHRSIGTLVSNVDVTPTLLAMAGVPAGPFDGKSLVRLFAGGSLARGSILLEHANLVSGVPSYCGSRTRRWKYVVYRSGFEELYDLANDPDELRNAARRRPALVRSFRESLASRCSPLPPGFPVDFWSRFG